MGLSKEDKAKIPYFQEMKREEEIRRWKEATNSAEYVQATEKFRHAVEEHLYQRIKAYFKARDVNKPTVGEVIKDTEHFTKSICEDLVNVIPYLTEKMLEKFNLVKGEAKP